jgi:hypothetical protein
LDGFDCRTDNKFNGNGNLAIVLRQDMAEDLLCFGLGVLIHFNVFMSRAPWFYSLEYHDLIAMLEKPNESNLSYSESKFQQKSGKRKEN